MGKLIVVEYVCIGVRLDNEEIRKPGIYYGDILEVFVPARARAKNNRKIFKLNESSSYVLLSEIWDAKSVWKIVKTENATLYWEYSDHHGRKGGALLGIQSDNCSIDYDVPGHHNHYIEKYRITISNDEFVKEIRIDESYIIYLP